LIVLWQGWTGGPSWPLLLYGTVVPLFVFWTHRGNISRLLAGTERKLSRGAATRQ